MGHPAFGILLSGGGFSRLDRALVWINYTQTLDDPEIAIARLGNVHVHADVMLTGHHFSRATWALSDLCMVQSLDHIFLL